MNLLQARRHLDQANTAYAQSAPIKSSVYKLDLVADMVRNMKVSSAMLQLQFCKKKVASDMYAVLKAAVSNAENNFGLDIDRLYISEILVNKGFFLRRFRPKARGRAGKIMKPFSNIAIFVSARS